MERPSIEFVIISVTALVAPDDLTLIMEKQKWRTKRRSRIRLRRRKYVSVYESVMNVYLHIDFRSRTHRLGGGVAAYLTWRCVFKSPLWSFGPLCDRDDITLSFHRWGAEFASRWLHLEFVVEQSESGGRVFLLLPFSSVTISFHRFLHSSSSSAWWCVITFSIRQ